MPDTVRSSENPRTSERRLHPRKQLWFPYIHLGADNGGIILDISESGLAMQALRSLADSQLPAMRFQLSESRTWIETRGRIAWISASKKRVGVEFVGLPEEARNQIRQWVPWTLHPSRSAEEDPLGEQIEPAKNILPASEPETGILVPEPETTGHVDENQGRHSNAEDPAGVLPTTAETQDAETVSLQIRDKSSDRGRTAGSRKSRKRTGVFLATVLLLSAFFLLASRFHRNGNSSQGTEVRAAAKVAELSPDSSANPKTLSVDPSLPLDQPGFVLQVGAMTHEENADALAESLRQRNFTVIVSRSGTSRFYRLVVGPYSDVDSTLRVKEQLKKQGFDALRTPWNPSAR